MNQLLVGPSIGLEVIADNAVEKMKYCKGQTKESMADDMPTALRVLFEREDMRNGIHCADNDEDVARVKTGRYLHSHSEMITFYDILFVCLQDTAFFFENAQHPEVTVTLKNTTLGVIKPHAIKEGNMGKIISEITSNGFRITALRMHILERVNCEEFYEVYRGIVPEYIVSMNLCQNYTKLCQYSIFLTGF